MSDVLARIIEREPDFSVLPPTTPPSIVRLLRRSLEKDRKRRLPDIADARLEIDDALTVSRVETVTAGVVKRRRHVGWIATAALLLVGMALGAIAVRLRAPDPPAQVTFEVVPPSAPSALHLTVSPDGKYVSALIASDKGTVIWLRSLDRLDAQIVNGSEGAFFPFWSPDSQSVGFIAGAALKIVSASGGPPQTLCEGHGADSGREAARGSPNGTIVFSTLRGLSRVSAAGGPCAELVGSEVCRGFCRHPVFLPDGDHFLYVNLAEDESVRGLYVASLAEPVGRRLLADRSSAIFVPDALGSGTGRLVFVRQETLMAQPFDAAALRLSGQPETVAPNVDFTVDLGRIAASADNHGTLMFVQNAIRDKRLAWFYCAGVERGEVAARVPAGGVIAPDGRRLAMPRTTPPGIPPVWTRDLNRNQELRISNGATPVWAPDSQRLVFGGSAGLVVKNVNNEAEETLVAGAGQQIWPSDWSRDNRWLVYSLTDRATQSDIWLLADPSRPSPERRPQPWLRTPASESHAQISPDGRWIVYTSETQVYLRPFSGAALSPNQWALSDASTAAFEPRWRGDSKELFFLTGNRGVGRKALMSVAISATAMPPVGVPTQLFEFQSTSNVIWQNRYLYSPSADGQRFLTAVHTAAYRPSLEMIRNWGGTGRSK